jgi:hypothetical protein
MDDSNGIEVREARDMLRLESQILLSQLHIRRCIEVNPMSMTLTHPTLETHNT